MMSKDFKEFERISLIYNEFLRTAYFFDEKTLKKFNFVSPVFYRNYIDTQKVDKVVYLEKFLIPINERSKGLGSRIMKELITTSNKTNTPIFVILSDVYGYSLKRLINFYLKFNFYGIGEQSSHNYSMVYFP